MDIAFELLARLAAGLTYLPFRAIGRSCFAGFGAGLAGIALSVSLPSPISIGDAGAYGFLLGFFAYLIFVCCAWFVRKRK